MLSEKGRFYLVVLKQNNVPEIQKRMLHQHGLESKVRAKYQHFSQQSQPPQLETLSGKGGGTHSFQIT